MSIRLLTKEEWTTNHCCQQTHGKDCTLSVYYMIDEKVYCYSHALTMDGFKVWVSGVFGRRPNAWEERT